MATYLQGVTDVIQPFQPFTPNFDFYNQALQLKHEQYQQGYKQLSGLYSTILNSPLTRDENISRRDQFFKDTDKEIKKISGVDLSLPQNVQAASQIFKPFYQDKPMMVDMVVTKSIDDSRQAHEILKNCVGKDCEKFGAWDEGLKAVEYRREEFKKTGTDESLTFGKVSYTPRVKYAEDVLKFLKDQKFKITREEHTGRYDITYENGDLLEKPLYNMIKTLYQDDSNVTAMYDTKAYVARKDYARSNAPMFNGSEEEAEKQYLNDKADVISKSLDGQLSEMDLELNSSKAKLNLLETKIKNKGISMNSKDAQQYRYLSQLVPILEKGRSGLVRNKEYFSDLGSVDIKTLRGRIDGLVANEYFDNDVKDIAHDYSQATSSITSKANPFAVAEFTSALSLHNLKEMAKMNFEMDIAKMDYKDALERKQLAETMGAGEELNVTTTAPGEDNMSKEDLYTTNTRTINEEVNGYMGGMRDVLTDVYTHLYNASKDDTDQGKIAKKDFARLFPGAKPEDDTFGEYFTNIKGYKTYESKYTEALKIIKGNDLYKGLVSNKSGVISNVSRKKMVVDAIGKLQTENGRKIKSSMENDIDSDLDSDYIPYVKDFFTNQNGIVPKAQFQAKLVQNGMDADDAGEIYDEMTEEYIRQYSDGTRDENYRVRPFYGEVVTEQGGGVVGIKPVYLDANPLKKLSQNYAAAQTIISDIQNSGYDLKEGSIATRDMVQQFIRDFSKSYDPKKENAKMPLATFKYEGISDRDGYAKVTITPDKQWLEDNIVGAKKETEAADFEKLTKGFELYIPKDKANNVLESRNKSYTDLIFETNNNKIQIGEVDDAAGYATITRDPDTKSFSVFQKNPRWDPNTLQQADVPFEYSTNSVYNMNSDKIFNEIEARVEASKALVEKINERLEGLKIKTNNPQEVLNGQ